MRTLEIAYCVVRKNSRKKNPQNFSPVLYDSRMPIYWLKKVAEFEAERAGGIVLKVVVQPVDTI